MLHGEEINGQSCVLLSIHEDGVSRLNTHLTQQEVEVDFEVDGELVEEVQQQTPRCSAQDVTTSVNRCKQQSTPNITLMTAPDAQL